MVVEKSTVTITKDKVTIKWGNGDTEEYSYKTDESKSPKVLDLTDLTKKKARPGIYEPKGADLKIIYNMGKDRPTQFVAGDKFGPTLLTLKRDK